MICIYKSSVSTVLISLEDNFFVKEYICWKHLKRLLKTPCQNASINDLYKQKAYHK